MSRPAFEGGAAIVVRHEWRGLLWGAEPATVVSDDGHRLVHWRPAGTTTCSSTSRGFPGREDLEQGDRQLVSMQSCDWLYRSFQTLLHTLTFVEDGRWCRVDVGWLPSGDFIGWYVNFQLPMRRRPDGYDTMDLVVDIVVDPQRSWRWKDVDHFERAKDQGLVTAEVAEAIEREADRTLRDLEAGTGPFAAEWERWTPPDGMGAAVLPEDVAGGLRLPPGRELPGR